MTRHLAVSCLAFSTSHLKPELPHAKHGLRPIVPHYFHKVQTKPFMRELYEAGKYENHCHIGNTSFRRSLLSKLLGAAQADYSFPTTLGDGHVTYRCDLLDDPTASDANASNAHAFLWEAYADNTKGTATAMNATLSSKRSSAEQIPVLEKIVAQRKNSIKNAHRQMQRRFGCSLK
jgi:hypothetical protein